LPQLIENGLLPADLWDMGLANLIKGFVMTFNPQRFLSGSVFSLFHACKTETALLCVLFAVPMCARAIPMNGLFQWTGDLGYSVEATFTYDSSVPTVVGVPPSIGNVGLIDLYVSVFDPGGALLDGGYDVIAGITQYPWLEFSFDTATLDLSSGSFLDIGWDPGYWLQGHPPDGASFQLWGRTAEIDIGGSEAVVDSGGSYRIITRAAGEPSIPVPESGSTLGMLTIAFGTVLFFTFINAKRRQRFTSDLSQPKA
jgi:hypothetical protein